MKDFKRSENDEYYSLMHQFYDTAQTCAKMWLKQ